MRQPLLCAAQLMGESKQCGGFGKNLAGSPLRTEHANISQAALHGANRPASMCESCSKLCVISTAASVAFTSENSDDAASGKVAIGKAVTLSAAGKRSRVAR